MYILRFDMRAPVGGPASPNELYNCAIEMAAWGESRGCFSTVVSQHHGADDGFLPSPMILASAIASRTKSLPINVGALLLNMYDPIKLAEDMQVLDIISAGRVSYTIGLGYRQEEYDMFGVDYQSRGKLIEENLQVLTRALKGEEFEYQGRKVHVTPSSHSPNGVTLNYGGQSPVAAKRAGRYGMAFFPSSGGTELEEIYLQACKDAGNKPQLCWIPKEDHITSLFVAEDVDKAWDKIGSYLLYDAQTYAGWLEGTTVAASSTATTVDELRKENGPYRIVTPEFAIDLIKSGGHLAMQPLCGGMPPELAWESLHLVDKLVMPYI